MRKTGETARAEARIKQLCCLGLGGEAIVPALLGELHGLIPSCHNNFFWADEVGRPSNVYGENPEQRRLAPLYVEEFYNKRERELTRTFGEIMRFERGVTRGTQTLKVPLREFYRSDFYNLILRPEDTGHLIRLVPCDSSRSLGLIQLHRSREEPDFDEVHVRRLARLEPFLAHLLASSSGNGKVAMADSGESGLVIADPDGKLLHCSAQARRLLYLATHPRASTNPDVLRRNLLPPRVAALCRHLCEVYAGKAETVAPVVRHCNVWGQFVFRAYWLDSAAPGEGHIGITVTRDEPLCLKLWRGARGLPLTRRQSEVAILLAAGHTHAEIAQRLHITRNTAISHSRWIYDKLGVHDAAALREKLLADNPGAVH